MSRAPDIVKAMNFIVGFTEDIFKLYLQNKHKIHTYCIMYRIVHKCTCYAVCTKNTKQHLELWSKRVNVQEIPEIAALNQENTAPALLNCFSLKKENDPTESRVTIVILHISSHFCATQLLLYCCALPCENMQNCLYEGH